MCGSPSPDSNLPPASALTTEANAAAMSADPGQGGSWAGSLFQRALPEAACPNEAPRCLLSLTFVVMTWPYTRALTLLCSRLCKFSSVKLFAWGLAIFKWVLSNPVGIWAKSSGCPVLVSLSSLQRGWQSHKNMFCKPNKIPGKHRAKPSFSRDGQTWSQDVIILWIREHLFRLPRSPPLLHWMHCFHRQTED